MGKPYSLDLRERVVAAIEGGMSRNQAAKQFGVAISTAILWMQRVEETGSVAPGQMGGHKPKAISRENAVWLSQRIRSGDFTLRGLVAERGPIDGESFGVIKARGCCPGQRSGNRSPSSRFNLRRDDQY
jgi:transposase